MQQRVVVWRLRRSFISNGETVDVRSAAGWLPALLLMGCTLAGGALAADDYLSELDAEAKKVEARSIDGEAGTSTVEAPAEIGGSTGGGRSGASRERFESLLRQKYLGTFGFYKKLPERSRQEIFIDYRDGAPMAEVRKKIIDRLLQR